MKWGFDSLTANNKPAKVKRAREGKRVRIFFFRITLVNLKSENL